MEQLPLPFFTPYIIAFLCYVIYVLLFIGIEWLVGRLTQKKVVDYTDYTSNAYIFWTLSIVFPLLTPSCPLTRTPLTTLVVSSVLLPTLLVLTKQYHLFKKDLLLPLIPLTCLRVVLLMVGGAINQMIGVPYTFDIFTDPYLQPISSKLITILLQ